MKEKKERLAKIASQNKTSKEDKQFVLDMCHELGAEFEGNTRCSSCYRDMAAKLWSLIKGDEKHTDAGTGRKIMVVAGTYIWNHRVISNATVKTDEECEQLMASGCPKRLFVYEGQ